MATVGLHGVRGPVRTTFDGLICVAIMIPGIVVGIAKLIALVTAFKSLNQMFSAIWPNGIAAPKLNMGKGSPIAAHTLFTMR